MTKRFPFCSAPGIGARPKHGALYFLDYTDEQIESMGLPAWQKPMIVAMAHYGGYVGDTWGMNHGTLPSRFEGADAFATAGIDCPIFKWLDGQRGVRTHTDAGSLVYTGGWWENLGNYTGVNCKVVPCGVLHHMHVADECVPLGMAGLVGGCG